MAVGLSLPDGVSDGCGDIIGTAAAHVRIFRSDVGTHDVASGNTLVG